MTKLAIVDLDGAVADNTERFKRAEEAREAYRNDINNIVRDHVDKRAIDIYWQAAFTPELVSLDTLIEGASEAINALEKHGYTVIFLTSRPESMRKATIDWFWSLTPDFVLISSEYHSQLVMKAPAFQYTKTTVWKAGMVQTLASLYGANEVLFVDDEAANAAEVMNHAEAVEYQIQVCSSLKLAVEAVS